MSVTTIKWLYKNFPDWERRSELIFDRQTAERRWCLHPEIKETLEKAIELENSKVT